MEKVWRGANGDIPYNQLENSYLLNIKKYIERKSKEGYKVISGGGICPDDFWLDEDIYYGKDALDYLDYNGICEEINNRGLTKLGKT